MRKHQVYTTPEMAEKILQDPDTIIRILQEIKSEREKRIAAEEKNRANAPKVLFADSVAQVESDILNGKDFTAAGTGRVYSAIEESLAEQEPQEAQQP